MSQPNTPTFNKPAQNNLLCNFHGSNTGADAIGLSAHYTSPGGSADPPSLFRAVVQRTFHNQGPDATTMWDSGWVGNPMASQPSVAPTYGAGSAFTVNGRAYLIDSHRLATVPNYQSAPAIGGQIGKWRTESGMDGSTISPGGNVAAAANGYIVHAYGISNAIRFRAAAIGGGAPTFTDSATFVTSGTLFTPSAGAMIGVGPYLIFGGYGSGTGATLIFVGTVAANGTITFDAGHQISASLLSNFGIAYDPVNSYVYVLGGDTGSAVVTTVQVASFNATTGVLGSFGATSSLNTAATGIGFACQIADGHIFVVGGYSDAAHSTAITTVQTASVGVGSLGAFGTSTALSVASGDNAVFAGSNLIYTIGGSGAFGNPQVATYTGGTVGTWTTASTSSELTAAQLGTGGGVTNNPDSSTDLAFDYGAFGNAITASFVDGDQMQVTVYVASGQTGDQAASNPAVIKIGQPPAVAVTSPSATVTTGQPTITGSFSAGAGALGEASWRTQLTDTSDATVYDDSGTVAGVGNSRVTNPSPALVGGTSYHYHFTATGLDTPYPGSSVSATAVVTESTSLTPPAVPTNVVATPNNAQGSVTITWTDPNSGVAPTTNRVYYRQTAVGGAYTLLKQGITSPGLGGNGSITLMDELAFNVQYDFVVSAVAAGAESAQSASSSCTIAPPAGTSGYTAMLHVAGNGLNYSAPLIVKSPPVLPRSIETTDFLAFGAVKPTAIYGDFTYRHIALKVFGPTQAAVTNWESVLAQAMLGNTLYYRDGFGNVLYVAPETAASQVTYSPPSFRDLDIKLVEVAFSYQP
ncbi:MAG: hypothetical protein ACYDAY_11400 [Candidatus Dormibacteria bacterium]